MKSSLFPTRIMAAAFSFLLVLAACGAAGDWLAGAALDADETPEMLYEKAKAEGKVVIYTLTSRVLDAKESFEERYPGIKLEVYDMRMSEILEKYEREYEAGIHTADVLLVKDDDGIVQNEFVETGMMHRYIPADYRDKYTEDDMKYGMILYTEFKQLFYNTEVYPACPITSWWDLTKPEYKGKVMVRNPASTNEVMGFFMAMVNNSDQMAEEYKKVFGEDIVLDGTENAGYEYIKRLHKNQLILTESDGDICKAIGTPGQSNPPFGIVTSSKLRTVVSDGLAMDATNDITPAVSVNSPAFVFIADQSEHVNAAKLLIRWISGEADGDAQGFKKFVSRGCWSVRKDQPPFKGNLPYSDIKLWELDLDKNYEMVQEINDFWFSIL